MITLNAQLDSRNTVNAWRNVLMMHALMHDKIYWYNTDTYDSITSVFQRDYVNLSIDDVISILASWYEHNVISSWGLTNIRPSSSNGWTLVVKVYNN